MLLLIYILIISILVHYLGKISRILLEINENLKVMNNTGGNTNNGDESSDTLEDTAVVVELE